MGEEGGGNSPYGNQMEDSRHRELLTPMTRAMEEILDERSRVRQEMLVVPMCHIQGLLLWKKIGSGLGIKTQVKFGL